MLFSRINGFYFGAFHMSESKPITIDERNNELNEALATRLNQLNVAIEHQEKQLKAMMIVCDTQITYRTGDEIQGGQQVGEHSWHIGVIKLKGGWRLCHATQYEHFHGAWDEQVDWKPLVDCSIEERIEASSHIAKLREAIVESKQKLMPDLEKAIESLAGQSPECE